MPWRQEQADVAEAAGRRPHARRQQQQALEARPAGEITWLCVPL
jgi:hypothetical protein